MLILSATENVKFYFSKTSRRGAFAFFLCGLIAGVSNLSH